MTVTVRTWASEGDFWAYLLDFPRTVVVDGEAFGSAEELWDAYAAGLFDDYRDLGPEESGYDDKAFHVLSPDCERWADKVWGWAQFWGSHLEELGDEEYRDRFAAFRAAHVPGEPPAMVAAG